MKQSRATIGHDKIPIAYFKTLISYSESSLYADQKTCKKLGDALPCVLQELRSLKLAKKEREAYDINKFSPVPCNLQVQ